VKQALNLLLSLIGTPIERLVVELYVYEDDDYVTINSVGLGLGSTEFVIGCAGDGGIDIKKGQPVLSRFPEDHVSRAKLYEVESCKGLTIVDIKTSEYSLSVITDESELEMVNYDDELIIIKSGAALEFDDVSKSR